MRILIVKTSSLGDIVHMLPAITDAVRSIPNLTIDWVVEESFQDVPSWHPSVESIFPVAVRRWRKQLFSRKTIQQIRAIRSQIQTEKYDAVIDSQGLLKSSVICHWARGERFGYDRHSAREPLATWAYDQRLSVAGDQHAISRNRQITAQVLGYPLDNLSLDYGLENLLERLPADQEKSIQLPNNYVIALHGTSRVNKEWPEQNWLELAQYLDKSQISLVLPWGNSREHDRAQNIAAKSDAVVLPKSRLNSLAKIIKNAKAVVGMDTGLIHIAAALGKPGVAIYPVTRPDLTGVISAENDPQIINLDGHVSTDMLIEKLKPMLTD